MVAGGGNEKFKWHNGRRSRASCRAVFIKYKWDALLQLYEEKSVPSAPRLSGTSLFMMLFPASAHVMFYIFHFFQLENHAGDLVRVCFPLSTGWLLLQIWVKYVAASSTHVCVMSFWFLGENFGNMVASSWRPIHKNPTSSSGCVYTHTQTCTRTAQWLQLARLCRIWSLFMPL